jgi:mono/diheme cytochrome c family protein
MMGRIVTILVTVAVILLAGWIGLRTVSNGFSTREPATAVERYLAKRTRQAAISAAERAKENPIANSPEVLSEARAHWADHCASCHANNGSGDVEIGRNLYPPAPDMRLPETQSLTDGELFFIIENGIRMTGMPAWGTPGKDSADSWKLVHFIRHLPQIADDEELSMRKMNPRTPAELEEEKAEEDFLKGEEPHAQTHSHH